MKTQALLKLLNEKEKLALSKQLKEADKVRLQKALSVFIKETEPTKEELYKAIFGEKYTTTKDVNLRNELRLLNEEIEDVLVARTLKGDKNRYYKQRILLDVFYVYKADDLFQATYNEALDDQKSYPYAKRLVDLLELKVLWHTRKYGYSHPKSIDLWHEIMQYKSRIENYALQIDYFYSVVLNAIHTNLLNTKYSKKMEEKVAGMKPAKPMIFSAKLIQELEPQTISQYYSILTMDSDVNEEEKLNILLQSINMLEKYPEFIFGRYNKIAFYYLNNEDIENYCKYTETAYQLFLSIKHLRDANLHYNTVKNYIIRCVLLCECKEALDLSDLYKSQLKEHERNSKELNLFLTAANVLDGNIDAAYRLLPTNFSNYSQEELFFARALFVIVHIELHEFEFSQREIDNITRAIKATPKNRHFKEVFKGLFLYLNFKKKNQKGNIDESLSYFKRNDIFTYTLRNILLERFDKY